MCENNVKILTTGSYDEVCKYLDNCEKTCQKYYGCYTVSLLNKKLENMESICNKPEYQVDELYPFLDNEAIAGKYMWYVRRAVDEIVNEVNAKQNKGDI